MDKTLYKGLKLIEVLAQSDSARGVTDLARELKLNKSNIHRVLKTLETAGYVNRDAKLGQYELSLKVWELGCLVMSRLDIANVARVQLEQLAAETRETVHLSVLDGSDVIYIDKIDSLEPVAAYTRIGGRAPAYAVATGKAQIAHMPDGYVAMVADALEKFTPKTIRSAGQLKTELAQIRQQGYAVNLGEWRETVFGLAAPIYGARSTVEAAIGISGPSHRLKARKMKEFADTVIAAANAISKRLGYRAPAANGRRS